MNVFGVDLEFEHTDRGSRYELFFDALTTLQYSTSGIYIPWPLDYVNYLIIRCSVFPKFDDFKFYTSRKIKNNPMFTRYLGPIIYDDGIGKSGPFFKIHSHRINMDKKPRIFLADKNIPQERLHIMNEEYSLHTIRIDI